MGDPRTGHERYDRGADRRDQGRVTRRNGTLRKESGDQPDNQRQNDEQDKN
jgi:hypothetical protein